MPVLFDLVHDLAEVFTDLLEGVLTRDLFPSDIKGEELGIGGNDLVQGPVLDLEDDQTSVLRVKNKIRLMPSYIWLIPGNVPYIRLGTGLKKPIKDALSFGCERMDINRDPFRDR